MKARTRVPPNQPDDNLDPASGKKRSRLSGPLTENSASQDAPTRLQHPLSRETPEPRASMPAIENKKRKPTSRSAKQKTKRSSKSKSTPPLSRKPRNHPRPLFQKKEHKTAEGPTFLYECARPGCGYRIWREDKDETGHLRFDLKCPKCHHQVFRCLGKEDVPEKFGTPIEPNKDIEQQTLDFGALSTHDLSE